MYCKILVVINYRLVFVLNATFSNLSTHIVWSAPIISIVLSFIIKLLCNQEKLSLLLVVDSLDFGVELSVTSMLILVANGVQNPLIYITWLACLMVGAIIIRSLGWKSDNQKKFIAVLIPDLFGILSLLFSVILLKGGVY